MTSARKADDELRPAGSPNEQVEGSGPEDSTGSGELFSDSEKNSPPAPAGDDEGAEVSDDLDALLADVQRERDEYLDLAKRAKADFENYRKRAAKDAQAAEVRGKGNLARELVPVLDNLERALRAADDDSELARGVALVRVDLEETLKRAGVEAYDPLGEPFDPIWHEALSTQPADGTDSGTVLETVERGYRLDGQVLRAARVVVSE